MNRNLDNLNKEEFDVLIIGGGIYCNVNADPVLKNTILWGNADSSGLNQIYLEDTNSDPEFSYCDVQGDSSGFAGNGSGALYLGTYQDNFSAF